MLTMLANRVLLTLLLVGVVTVIMEQVGVEVRHLVTIHYQMQPSTVELCCYCFGCLSSDAAPPELPFRLHCTVPGTCLSYGTCVIVDPCEMC